MNEKFSSRDSERPASIKLGRRLRIPISITGAAVLLIAAGVFDNSPDQTPTPGPTATITETIATETVASQVSTAERSVLPIAEDGTVFPIFPVSTVAS